MKKISSFFEGILLCLRNKISDVDLYLDYIPYPKAMGILADETEMHWELLYGMPRMTDSFDVKPERYYSELIMILAKRGLISLKRKGKSGTLEAVELYNPKKLTIGIKEFYINRRSFFNMLKEQKALYYENLKIVERMTSLEKDVDLVEKYKNFRNNYNPTKDTFSGKSDDPKKDSLILYEYINLKSRMKDISDKLFLNFTPMN